MDVIIPDYSWHEAKQIDCNFDYVLKIINYGNRTTDLIMTKIKRTVADLRTSEFSLNLGVSHLLSDEEREEKRIENVKRSALRARQQVQYAVRSFGADHMLTLTTRGCVEDRAEFFKIFHRFTRLVREKDLHITPTGKLLITRQEKRIWQYVAVPELQKRGAYHMHLAVKDKQDLELLNACWYVALGGSPNDSGDNTKGAVNVVYRKKKWGNQSLVHRTLALCAYLTKYMTKSFEETEELGINRYARAHDIKKPQIMKQFLWSSFANSGDGYIEAIQEVYAIADFMGLVNMEPFNRSDSKDFFVLRGVWG